MFPQPLQVSTHQKLGHDVREKIASLKSEVESIINGTEWPSKSDSAATSLLNTVKSSPELQSSTLGISQELQDLIEQYIRVLENVYTRLKNASSETSMQKWRFLQPIKSMTSNRSSKYTLLLEKCQDDVSKAADPLRERLDQEQSKGDDSNALKPKQLSVPPASLQTNSAGQSVALAASLSSTPQNQNSSSPNPVGQTALSPISKEALIVARKTFKSVEIASGSIPVVGSYVGAAAKVGLAFVESLQTMDKNSDLASDLGGQTAKLSKLLEGFMKKPNADQGEEIAEHVDDLHKELRNVHDKVKEWESLGRFDRAFHARDHAEVLKAYQGTIQVALEEMQLLVSLDTHCVINELKNRQLQEQQRRLLRCLGDGKYGAQGNAIEDVICSPGTRMDILERIDSWVRDSSDRVLWVRGMAGRGKSTIASTVVHRWKYRASCAIFHFRRGQNTLNMRIVCSLARQLATSLVPEVKNAVLESVRENEDIADQRLKEQFETLFVAPLARLNNQTHPILIVIDALDECDNPKDAVDFVRLIDQHSKAFPSGVKFLLTCRPEAPLLRALEPRQWPLEDLDTVDDVTYDLERFIGQAFQQIRDSDPEVPKDWPLPEDIARLVEMSQGLFQWARTAIAFVSSGSPVDRFLDLLKQPSVWTGLDELYQQILSKAFGSVDSNPVKQDILSRVLGALVVAPYPVSLEMIADLYGDHEIFPSTNRENIIRYLRKDILAELNSLLFIPPSIADPMRLMHTSIRDLLTSKLRCQQQPYYVDLVWHHKQLASTCFNVMRAHLKENICDLSDLSKPSSEVQDIMERDVSKTVRYCCRAWSTHLTEGVQWPSPNENGGTIELDDFVSFTKEKVMCWLEVMSLIGATAEAINMARRAYQWLLRYNGVLELSSLATLWHDVQRFITSFSEPISLGPLHVYVSALPHCPVETELWRLYGKHAKVQTVSSLRTATWLSNLWTRTIDARVTSVAFSPDGQVLASTFQNKTIQLWDTQTGMLAGEPLTGYGDEHSSVCYSPDGTVLASGSNDNTIRLWDTQTREAVAEPLKGHTNWVRTVCFSPDGKVLASGSDDSTIRLWNSRTKAAVGEPLTGHTSWVTSVCFSPDGKVLASGSNDKTIRLWDTRTGAAVGEPLKGHTDWIKTVCFSPDGKILASGSDDKTIRLWDAQTGAAVDQPLTGHTNFVTSVCFSPDGKVLASGSNDKTIRLWDTQTKAAVGGPLVGHTSLVTAVCFSPDGLVLASGSHDQTIRLWDTQAGAAVNTPLTGRPDAIGFVSFSPDGKRLASAPSNDETIQLWDIHTGKAVGRPLKGHTDWVESLCFSPDGKILASGARDKTIRFWNSQTGAVVGKPLKGHTEGCGSLCFSPDGKVLASGGNDTTIRLWYTQTGAPVCGPLRGHTDWVRTVCFSPDGKVLASGSDDHTIRLWDTRSGAALGEPLTGHTKFLVSLCFSPDGNFLASGSHDKTIRLWDAQTGARVAELLGSRLAARSLHFSLDGTLLITNYMDGSSASWSLITHQRCDTRRHSLCDDNPSLEDHWIMLSSSRFFWLPPQFWGNTSRIITLCGRTLVVLHDKNFSFFDISQALGVDD